MQLMIQGMADAYLKFLYYLDIIRFEELENAF